MATGNSVEAVVDLVRDALPLAAGSFDTTASRTGLVIVDEVNGFATVGAGALAPQAANSQVARMVDETDRLARDFAARNLPIVAFLDTHEPGKPEPPILRIVNEEQEKKTWFLNWNGSLTVRRRP